MAAARTSGGSRLKYVRTINRRELVTRGGGGVTGLLKHVLEVENSVGTGIKAEEQMFRFLYTLTGESVLGV